MKVLNLVSILFFCILMLSVFVLHVDEKISDSTALFLLFYFLILPVVNLIKRTGVFWVLLSFIPAISCVYIFSLIIAAVGNI